jgi:uncharacterized FlaG/YvyC family protein
MNPQNTSKLNTGLIETEIQHNIPVKQHSDDKINNPNPINSLPQLAHNDDDLDKVLKDVNKTVKETGKKASKKLWPHFHKKLKVNKSNLPPKPHDTKEKKIAKLPIVIVVAAIVAIGLGVSAVYAFGLSTDSSNTQPSNKSASNNTPAQTAKDQVTATDLNTLSSDLNTKIDSFSDSQDFNSVDLSDQNLGL